MVLILLFIVSYLIGSIPSGYLIGKIFFKKDIRKYGSGNMGATNSFRVLGKPAGFAVTFLIYSKALSLYFYLYFSTQKYTVYSWEFCNSRTRLSDLLKIPWWKSCCNKCWRDACCQSDFVTYSCSYLFRYFEINKIRFFIKYYCGYLLCYWLFLCE